MNYEKLVKLLNDLAQEFLVMESSELDIPTAGKFLNQLEEILAQARALKVDPIKGCVSTLSSILERIIMDTIQDKAAAISMLEDGIYLMQDISGSGHVHKDVDHPLGTLLYTVSCMHCMTVSLAEGGRGLGAMWGRKLALQMLDFVEFPMPVDTPARNLNTVQLKRLDLARALASKPRLLLLDELAAGLTTGELGDLMTIIRKIRDSGVTIILIEHIMRVIMGLSDRIAVIYYGAKIADGPTMEVAQDPRVAEAYLGEEYDL